MGIIGWLAAGAVLAAPIQAAAPEVRQVAPGLHVLIGTSGNVLIAPLADGVLIVDDERPTDYAEIVAAVAKLSPLPVRTVINTHWHLDHTGGNAKFRAAGATVIAQINVCLRRSTDQFMPAYNRTIPAAPAAALPNGLFDKGMILREGRERIRLTYAPAAHTDGDTIVRFERANVIHMGDIYFRGIWPFIDRASGGSVQGMIAAVDSVLKVANTKTVIVPAHGEIATRADLVKYRAMLAEVVAAVRERIARGETLEQVVAAKPAAPWRTGMEGNEDGFVGAVFDSLKNPDAPGIAPPAPSSGSAAIACVRGDYFFPPRR
ncbi:MBL fold metallo-hydrolase [Sphingomonas sp. LB-2]|uniref:MBL fold metallo-hydrolase n=1 Tax=Sphingomonas caeni TaxID=2984949 RepID=UPI0022327B27|nr:MBL fold metallo-hydrolase [Sphingomonas caeni]MCW3847173.1 MBL fold metallo-hydrolase [Sphingomonas caeni]